MASRTSTAVRTPSGAAQRPPPYPWTGSRWSWKPSGTTPANSKITAVYTTRFAGQRVWTDYWIPGHKGYTSGASGTADSTGDVWLTFRLIGPHTGAELDILSSVSDGPTHTDPAHKRVTSNC
ncbi:hypothetical protein ACIA6C_14585 [Streptomyces sp. NPDC051578]|uniref:hypothetical protein n=1 Tax=Streptomyces sp. NPDC051578 TaxID=3365662 RepID=UPI0037BC083F